MNTLASQFAGWAEMVIPPNAGQVQRDSMKMGFYAGAAALYGLLTNAADADETDEVAVTRLANLERELRAYVETLPRPGTPR